MKITMIQNFKRAWKAVSLCVGLQLCLVPITHATITEVGYWRMGENDASDLPGTTSSSTIDYVGTNSLALYNGPIYWGVTNSTAIAHAGSGSSLMFSNSAYGVATVIALTNDFGLECWVKPSSTSGDQALAYDGSTGGNGWGLYLMNGTYQALFGDVTFFGSATATAGTWAHLALVVSNGTGMFYVNGTSAGTTTQTLIPPAGNFGVACNPDSPSANLFTGLIDEVRVFTFASNAFSTNDLLINAGPPTATTSAATLIASNNATLNATVNGNGLDGGCYFQYGTNTSYGNNTAVMLLPASKASSNVSAMISGLTAGVVYHFRAVASNSVSTVLGADQTLTALNDPLVTVCWWHLGENDPGAVAGGLASATVDSVGGQNLTVNGGGAYYSTSVNAAASANADSFLSINFSNGASYASGPVPTTVNNNFGIEGWFYPTAINNSVLFYNGNAGLSGWGLGQTGTNYQILFGNVIFQPTGAVIALNTWTHLALVCNGGVATLYTNGEAAGSVTATPNPPSGSFAIGANAGGGNISSGLIDEVRIFTFAAGTFSTNFLLLNVTNLVVQVTSATSTGTSTTGTTLSASVNPNTVTDSTVDTYFLWGTSTNYGNTNLVVVNGSNAPVAVSNILSTLNPDTLYHYEVVASNALAVDESGDQTFTTLNPAPVVAIQAATGISANGATLHGTVNPNSEAASYYFQYGLTASYGQFTATNSLASTNVSEPVSAVLGGLQPATLYHFSLVASNASGTSTSSDATLTTTAQAPVVVFTAATPAGPTTENLSALINPGNASTSYYYRYGATTNYGSFSVTNTLTATNALVPTIVMISNLSTNSTYQCQLVAVNSAGTTTSANESFTPHVIVTGNSQTIVWVSSAPLTGQLTASGVPSGPTNFVVGQGPANGQLTPLSGFSTNGNWQYVPTVTNGVDHDAFVFYASDSFGDVSPAAIINIVITNLPYAVSQTLAPLGFNTLTGLVASGPTNFTIYSYPTNGQLFLFGGFATNGNWAYQPFPHSTNLVSTNFPDSFRFVVADTNGHVSLPGIVTIPETVNYTLANSESVSWLSGTTPTQVLSGAVFSGPTNFVLLTHPTNGTFTPLTGFATNGLWQYTPTNAPYNAGPDSFQFEVKDNGGNTSVPGTVSILVTNVSYANSQSIGWLRGQTSPISQLTGFTSPSPTNFVVRQNPLYGQLVRQSGFATNGLYQYVPYASNFFGADSFTFIVSNSSTHGVSLPATISITVTNIPVAPFAHFQYLKTRPGQILPITLSGDDDGNDPYFMPNSAQFFSYNTGGYFTPNLAANYTHTRDMRDWNPVFTVLTLPTNGTLTGTAPNLTYTPTNTNVFDSLTFKVNNGAFDSAPATVMIKVAHYNIGTSYFDTSFASNSANVYPCYTNDVPAANPGTVRPGFEGWALSASNGVLSTANTEQGAGVTTVTNGRTDDGDVDVTNFMDRLQRSRLFNMFSWYGTNFYIDNNGLISYQISVNAWESVSFPTDEGPVAAPLWCDVDTFPGTGASGLVTYGLGYVSDSFDGAPGRPALIITWADVAGYAATGDGEDSSLDRFQMVMIDRSDLGEGNFDLEYNYEYLQWLYGAASQGAYPGAGFDAGDGVHYYNLPNANTSGVSNYVTGSDLIPAVPGRWALRIFTNVAPIATNLAVSSIGATNATFSALFNGNLGWTATWFAVSNMSTGAVTNISNYSAGNILSGNTNFVAFSVTVGGLQSGGIYMVSAMASNSMGGTIFANTNNSAIFTTLPRLSSLSISPGSLSPSFNPDVVGYLSSSVGDATAITVSNSVENPTTNRVRFQLNGQGYSTNATLSPLQGGFNELNVLVVSSYGATNIYTVNLINTLALDSTLTNLTVSSGTLSPTFAAGISNYSDTVSNAATNLVITATSSSAYATIQINGGPVTTNTNSTSVALGFGANIVTIAVTAEDTLPVSNYTVAVFRNFGPPIVTIQSPTAITSNSAVLNASVNPQGTNALVYFQYGQTTNYGSVTTNDSLPSAVAGEPVGLNVGGLIAGSLYHYRAVASSAFGATNSADQMFSTSAAPPFTLTVGATNITASTATLSSAIDPEGATTGGWFKYGLSTNYGGATSTNLLLATNAMFSVTNVVSNLAPGTSYHFTVIATNSAGTNTGGDLTFVTADIARSISNVFFPSPGHLVLQFTGGPNVNYTVLTSTNITLPLSNWTSLGVPTVLSNNVYQFIDTNASNAQQYYMLQ